MSYTGYAQESSGLTLYAKPLPLTTGASWGSDDVAGVENGATGSYAFADLDESTPYIVFQQAGGAPAASDEAISSFEGAGAAAAAILAAGDVDGYSMEEALKLCLAVLVGKLSGGDGTTITIRAADDSKTRITATVDVNGNRSALTLDAS